MTLEELEIVVKANVDEATKKLDELKAKMEELENSEDTQKNFEDISKSAEGMGDNIDKGAEAIKTTTQSAENLAPAVEQSTTSITALVGTIKTAIPTILAVAGAVVAIIGVLLVVVTIIKLWILQYKALIKLFKMTVIPVLKAFRAVIKEVAKAIRAELTHAITTLKQKLSAGVNNLVQVNSKLNESLSSLKSSLTQTGNALATAVAPIIEAIIPLMNSLLQTITNLATGIAQVTASLFGNATVFKRAKKVNEDYAKSVGKATGANKKLLASFDELNVLSEDNGSGGASVLDMFEDAPIDSEILDFTEKLKEAWNADDIEGLEDIGATIGQNIKQQLDDLPAEEWGQSIGNTINKALALVNGFLSQNHGESIGRKIAEFILGFIKKLTPEQVGMTIANIINNGVKLVWSFVKKMNAEDGWAKVGQWIADSFNTAVYNINATDIGESIGGFISGALELAYTFFEGTDWVEVGNKIADVLIAIDWLDILTKLIRAIWSQWVALETVRYTIWENIKENLWDRIGETGRGIIKLVVGTLEITLMAIKSAIFGIPSILGEGWGTVTNWFNNNVAPIFKPSFWAEKFSQMDIGGAFKKVINSVIQIFESGINFIIRTLNKLHWELPDWLGGYSFGFNLKEVKIPRLAKGGVITEPTTILAGEYAGASQNPEIVAPQKVLLETSTQANVPVMNAIEEMGDKLVTALDSIGVYAEFDYSKLKVGLDNENYRVGGKLYGV